MVSGAAREAVQTLAIATLAANPQGEAGDHPIYPEPLDQPWNARRQRMAIQLYELLGIARDDLNARAAAAAENFRFFGAPVGLFFVIDKRMRHGQWAHLGMFMQNLALLASEQGLGSCMQEAWAMVRQSLHRHFALNDNQMIYCGMALGHPAPHARVNQLRSEREEVDCFARFEGF